MTIRRTPHDFSVVESLTPEFLGQLTHAPASAHPHALFQLTKTSLSTPEACQRLARSLATSPARVSPAGLKDKHAHTLQHVSVQAAPGTSVPSTCEGPGWSARHLGWLHTPITSAAIDHNAFTIVVRDLSSQSAREIDRRAALLRHADSLIFINYFGDQRFGSARHGQGFVASHLIRADFQTALKLAIATPSRKDTGAKRQFTRAAATHWGHFAAMLPLLPGTPDKRAIEHLTKHPDDFRGAFSLLPSFFQFMCVEAYQSFLWNATARRMAQAIADQHAAHRARFAPTLPTPDHPRLKPSAPPLLRTPDDFGEMLFPHFGAISDSWRDVDLPLLAPAVTLIEPWRDAALDTLAQESLTLDQLVIPGLKRPYFGSAPRRLLVQAASFTISASEHDDLSTRAQNAPARFKRTLSFKLPRGSYATVLLRALGQ